LAEHNATGPSDLRIDGRPSTVTRFGRIRALWRRLRGGDQSPGRVALAVAVGLFIGSLPLYGLHLVIWLPIFPILSLRHS
jgi:uncharacterized protein (DUF2062 family)